MKDIGAIGIEDTGEGKAAVNLKGVDQVEEGLDPKIIGEHRWVVSIIYKVSVEQIEWSINSGDEVEEGPVSDDQIPVGAAQIGAEDAILGSYGCVDCGSSYDKAKGTICPARHAFEGPLGA